MTPLTHELVRRIAREEADLAVASFDDVIGMAFGRRSKIARQRAMARLQAITGCSSGELARLWGCDRALVSRYRRQDSPLGASPYDPFTIMRLRWAHGDENAALIVAGKHPDTEADIATWRALGRLEP